MEKVKTKVRFTSLDVAAMVENLQCLIGMRATNIYDLNPSTYLFKLAKSEEKRYLLIENGVRFHTVEEKEDKKTIPSGFTMKFRKFLRSKRLESIRQVGVQRVVVLTFGSAAFSNHLILELYSQGNIILTDQNYRILQCIRSHQFNQKIKTAVGQIYPFEYAAHIYLENIDISEQKIQEALVNISQQLPNENEQNIGKKKKKQNTRKHNSKIKDLVFKLIPCLFPSVIQHVLLLQKINPDEPALPQNIEICSQACRSSFKFLKEFLKCKHKGFLFQKQKKENNEEPEFFQYSPYFHIKYSNKFQSKEFETFDASIQHYYKHYKKSQHEEEQQFEQLAWKKYDQIKRDQQSRVGKLKEQQEIYKLKAEYIEKNIQDVEALIQIIKTMEVNGYSWDDIGRMVSESKKNGDPLANLIHDLNIMKRQITILLGDPTQQEQYCELLPVEVNIDYNAYTNATMYYESKKKNYQKQMRTKEASEQVLKIAQKDAMRKIEKKKQEQLSKSVPTRKIFWFEKFYWFISSEGFLVIAGRDAHQNQTLVKRYMKQGDLYMHSDYGGAASTVIKRVQKNIPVPRTTLEEAAVFTVCRSKAWDTKIMSGAWWVYNDQVSKSAPTGEFLPTGSFMIRGKRNFVQPNRMEMGMTLLYKIDQQSVKRHINDRRVHEDFFEKQKVTEQETMQEEQYAIISLETTTKAKGSKKQQQKGKKQQPKPALQKKASQKGQDNSENNNSESSSSDSDQTTEKKTYNQKKQQHKQKTTIQTEQPQQKHKNRNKKKKKKLEKYMEEQDEEERDIIMKMIGAKEMKHLKKTEQVDEEQQLTKHQKKKKKKQKKKGVGKYFNVEEQDEEEKKLNPDKVLFLKKKQTDKQEMQEVDSEIQQNQKNKQKNLQIADSLKEREQICEKLSDEAKQNNSQKELNDKQENIQQESEQKENQENKEENQNENIDENEEQEMVEKVEDEKQKPQEEDEVDEVAINSELSELLKLVGKVHPQDHYENLVPMCAPYNSIKQNKFKLKLVPGGLKKGKAARNILHYFSNISELAEQQKPFVKSLPEQEVINALLGNVKLAGAGLLKMQQKEKAQKKEKRKQNEKKSQKQN